MLLAGYRCGFQMSVAGECLLLCCVCPQRSSAQLGASLVDECRRSGQVFAALKILCLFVRSPAAVFAVFQADDTKETALEPMKSLRFYTNAHACGLLSTSSGRRSAPS